MSDQARRPVLFWIAGDRLSRASQGIYSIRQSSAMRASIEQSTLWLRQSAQGLSYWVFGHLTLVRVGAIKRLSKSRLQVIKLVAKARIKISLSVKSERNTESRF